ncbi:MAG: hypothetical protein IJL52_10265 [Clostridia bacterium]|nr:hypothetical protein [Clostridia bacterium]
MEAAISTYSAYYTKTMAQLVALDAETLESVETAINTPYTSLLSTYGGDIYNYYFGDYDTDKLLENLESAKNMQPKIVLAQWLDAKRADEVNYSDTYDNLNAIWSEFNEKWETYDGYTDEVKTFLTEEGYIVPADVKAKLDEYKYAMDVAYLRDLYYDLITGAVATYSAYDLDWVAEHEGSATGVLSAAKTELSSYVTTLNSLDQTAVAYVFGEGYVDNVLNPLIDTLTDLQYASELKDEFLGYKSVYDTAFAPLDLTESDDALYAVLNSKDAWYTDLQAYIDELTEFDADFAAKVFNDLDTVMKAKINSVYVALKGRHDGRIDIAYDNYQAFVAQYGQVIEVSDVSMQNYTALRRVFNNINSQQVEFLIGSENFKNAVGTDAYNLFKEKYELIKRALFAFENFNYAGGLSAYEFNLREPVVDITRVVSEYDVIRDQDFTVDKYKRETVYDNVKKLLESDLVKGLLGSDEEGEESAGLLDGLAGTLREKIFSDSFVNTLISMVYPIVIDNFAPVWATKLPPTYGPIEKSGFSFTFNIADNLCTLREALAKLELYAMPDQLAARPELNAYPEIKAQLAAVTYDPVYSEAEEKVTVNPWNDPSLLDEDGKLALEWGVHDKDSFINALSAGLAGVAPILLALLSNKTITNVANIIGDGKSIKDSDTQYIFVTVTVTIDPINLTLEFKGNDGFNNALAPILNALGAETIGDGNSMDTLKKLATGIATPLDEILNKLEEDPLDFLLEALPQLAFAVSNGLIEPLLDNLKETITYSAIAHYEPDTSCADPGDETAVAPTDISVDVGEILLGGLGLDFSTAEGLVNSIIGLMNKDDAEGEGEGEEESGGILDLLSVLPINDLFSKLAYWGDYVEFHEGYRSVSPFITNNPDTSTDDMPYIVASASEVFAHIVDYLLALLKRDSTVLPALVDALGLDVDLEDEDSVIVGILNKIIADPDPAIAAIVELMLPVEYDNWAALENPATSFTYNEEEITPADVAYLKYANDWDEPTATAIATNVDELIPAVAGLFGSDVSLNRMLQDALNGLFTNATITTINNAIAGLFAPAEDAEEPGEGEEAEAGGLDLLGLLKDLVGIDLSSFEVVAEDHNWGFEDGDKAGFVDVLCGLLDPFAPLLKLMMPGEDLSALDGVVNINGYDVYPNSIALLFDALGIEQVENYAELSASELLKAILNKLLAWVDDLTAEDNSMIQDILELLPNLVYFIESNGLSVVIKNLLYPVLIVIDTIRPIYDLDILALLRGDEEAGAEPEGLAAILGDLDFDDLKLSSILAIVDAKLGTDLVNSPLCTYAIPALTIKNGDLEAADVLTILLCGLIEALESKISDTDVTNGDVIIAMIDEKLEDFDLATLYTNLVPLVTGSASEYEPAKINWTYMLGEGEIRLDSFTMPENPNEAVQAYLSTYNNTDWTEELVTYVDQNLDDIVATIMGLVNPDSDLATLLGGLLNDKLYTADILNLLGGKLQELLGNLEDQLKATIDVLLDTEIAGWTYTPVESVDGKDDFIAKLNDILDPFERILGFVLFDQGYKFFNGTTREDLIVLNGGDAYNAALAPVLEALGVDMPKNDGTKSVGEMVSATLTAVTDRLDEITADPINEILDLLPNVLYFLNAGGVKAAINNAVAPFDALIKLVSGEDAATLLEGVKIGAKGSYAGMALNDITTANLLELAAQLTGLVIPSEERGAITSFYIGKAEKYDSANGKIAFKLVYDGDRKDMITILVSVLLDVIVNNGTNPDTLDDLLGTDGLIRKVVDALSEMKNLTYDYQAYKWNYYVADADPEDATYTDGIGDGATFPNKAGVEYLTYPNDWTEAIADYTDENLEAIVGDILEKFGDKLDLDALTALLKEKLYTDDTVKALMNLLSGLLNKVPADLLTLIGKVVDVDFSGLLAYDAETASYGVTDKDSFIDALFGSNGVLTPFDRVFRFLLLGKNFEYLTSAQADTEGESILLIPGAKGYVNGLAPLLEALGVDAPAAGDAKGSGTQLMKEVADGILTRVEYILSLDNIVPEALALVPELLYFINADGLTASVNNTIAAVTTLIGMVNDLGIDGLDLSELQNTLDSYIGDLSFDGIAALVKDLTGIEIPAEVINYVKTNRIGAIESYDSAYGTAYRVASADGDRSDVITCILSAALETVKYGDNAAKLGELAGTDVIEPIVEILTEGVTPKTYEYNWNYTQGSDQTYLGYPNNWTRDTAIYVDGELEGIANSVAHEIDANYDTLSALLTDKVDLYSASKINAVGGALKALVETIDSALAGTVGEGAAQLIYQLLGVDWSAITEFEELPEGALTKDAFIDELKTLLTPFGKVLSFLLLGDSYKFFVYAGAPEGKAAGDDILIVNGANGYDEGLYPLLKALGCNPKKASEFADSDALVEGLLTAVCDRVDVILADPVDQIMAMLPNLIYFISANGLSASINNAITSLRTLYEEVVKAATGETPDLNDLLKGAVAKISDLETLQNLDINNLTFPFFFDLIEELTGINLNDPIGTYATTFNFGKKEAYTYADGKTGYTVTYSETNNRYDLVTIIASLLLDVVEEPGNETAFRELLGDNAYQLIKNLLNMSEVEMRQINWLFTEDANTGKVFSGMNTTVLFDKGYGPLFTQEMAAYIAENIDDFVDDMIQLLGITSQKHTMEDGKEEFITSLDQLLDEYVGESIYTKANLEAILGYLKSAIAKIDGLGTVYGIDLPTQIKAIVWRSLRKDASDNVTGNLDYYNDYAVNSFSDGDRAAFTSELIRMLDPLFPILKWLLCDEDIAFFLDQAGNDQVVLRGAEGYRYGLGPVLEALFCDGIPTPESLSTATSTDTLLRPILNALFNRLDSIFENPADEIFELLPNLAYFINSKGLDTCFKNLLNAVCALFEAIRPILPETMKDQDFYAMIYDLLKLRDIGLENGLETIDMQWIFDKIVAAIGEGSSEELDTVLFNAVAEMTTGKLESYDSMTGLPAYRMIHTEESKADTVTIVLRFAINWLATAENAQKLKTIIREKVELSPEGYEYTDALIDFLVSYSNTNAGIDSELHILYYIFVALQTGAAKTADWLTTYNGKVQLIKTETEKASKRDKAFVGLAGLFDFFYQSFVDDNGTTGNVFSEDGLAPRGFIAFFRQIIEWIKSIFAKLRISF